MRVWRSRQALGAVAGAAAVLAGAAAAPAFGAVVSVPAAAAVGGAVATAAGWPWSRRLLAPVTALAGAVSLAATAAFPHVAHAPDAVSGRWAMAEVLALLVLLALVARSAPARHAWLPGAAAAVGALAAATWVLRFVAPSAALAALTLPPLAAVTVGGYLRSLDRRRFRSVAEARRAQRLALARDLHDFVAHDVSEMLAQAQAGRILAERDPAAAGRAFAAIEQAAQRALCSMDRTVRMLHDTDTDTDTDTDADVDLDADPAAVRAPLPGLADLPDLAARFSASGPAQVTLDVERDLLADGHARVVGTTAYRVVVEALTNVRRHAPSARRVRVGVGRTRGRWGDDLLVEVVDDGDGDRRHTRPAGERRGGLGLRGLTERVEALGGTLTAGPRSPSGAPAGWRVAVVLPLADGSAPARGRGSAAGRT